MIEFLPYDELTWPEVQSLPRHTPLVLPVGSGYSSDRLAEALGNPPTAYLLPPFPFGWQGSGLAVSEAYLENYLTNITSGLRDDGFINTLLLIPPGLNLHISIPWIALPQNADTLPTLLPDTERDKVVLIPIGHTEQHWHHLPLAT